MTHANTTEEYDFAFDSVGVVLRRSGHKYAAVRVFLLNDKVVREEVLTDTRGLPPCVEESIRDMSRIRDGLIRHRFEFVEYVGNKLKVG